MPSADLEINLIAYHDGTVGIEVYTDFGRAVSVQLNHPQGTHSQMIPDRVRSVIAGRLPLPNHAPPLDPADEVADPRVADSHYIHPVAFFPVPRPRTGKSENISKATRITFLEDLVADLPTNADLNLILRTLNTVIDVVNRLAREARGR